MKRILLGAVSLLVLSAVAANAADLPPRTYTKAPIAPPVYNWSGFYVGAMGGYAWSDQVTVGLTGFGNVTANSSDLAGGFGGGTIGYNWQMPGSAFVFGLEADVAGSGIRYSETVIGIGTLETKIEAFGTVTGRAGWAVNNALFYAKGGFAWASNKFSAVIPGLGINTSDSQFHTGWTVGGGFEYGFTPNWSAKVEYLYADLGTQTYFNGLELGTTLHTVKGGVNYRF